MKKTVALIALLSSVGCSDSGTAAVETDYAPLLASISQQVALPAHQNAVTTADALVVTLKALEADPAQLGAAQAAWRAARAGYRGIDAFSYGPMISLGIDVRVDAPVADPGGIEASVAATDEITADYVGRLGGKKKGYLAIEYLLFKTAPGGFVAGGRRGTLARALGEEVAASMRQLYDAWDPSKNGWAKELSDAGNGGYYPTQRAALDELVGGGAYALELVVGTRLAFPLGRKGADNTEDPTLASDSAAADMLATMASVKGIYDTPGFTTMIRPAQSGLDDKANTEVADCIAKIIAIPKPFGDAVVQNTPAVQQAFDSCKAYKLTWNTDITSTLGASLKFLDDDGD